MCLIVHRKYSFWARLLNVFISVFLKFSNYPGRKKVYAKTASKDIHVFKLLDKDLISPYFYYTWVIGKEQETELCIDNTSLYHAQVDWGFHSFINIEAVVERRFRDFSSNAPIEVFRAVIPKGAKYVVGDSHDIASDRLIITGLA